MRHQETKRILPGADTAVLFMHGIAGTPDHFRTLLPLEQLVPLNWSCYNILIEGHGKTVSDFSHSSMEKWKDHVMGVFDALCRTHERIILVSHSMGTLFSIEMARKRPEKVAGLFLIAAPLRLGVKLFGVGNILRFGFHRIDPQDPVQVAVAQACSITRTWKLWKYAGWLPRIFELIRLMYDTAKFVPEVSIPAVAFQSRRDEMVSKRATAVMRKNPRFEVHDLTRSTHFYYHPEDIEKVQQRFIWFLSKVTVE